MKRFISLIMTLALILTINFGLNSQSIKAENSDNATIRANLGIGLEGLNDWTRAHMFADAMKTSRQWGKVSQPWIHEVGLDENGWPTEDAGIVVMVDQEDIDISGTYKLSFDGRADIVSNQATVSNKVYANGKTTADLNVRSGSTLLFIDFINTDKGVRNVKLLRPGYDEGDVYTREFLNALEPFSTLRFMDFLSTNSQNNISSPPYYDTRKISWSDRKLPTHASQAADLARARGVAWEYVIELANITKKDIWINVPYNVDNNYITQLATMLKNQLDPQVNVYVELSNEVWNWMFQQAQLNLHLSESDPEVRNYIEMYGKQVGLMALGFKEVFPNDMNKRIRVVLAWQSGGDHGARQQLEFIKNHYGDPSGLIYAYAIAPYFREPKPEDCTSIEAIHQYMIKDSDNSVDSKKNLIRMVNEYKLPGGLVAYEGGPHHQGQVETNLDIRIAAHRDQGMREIVKRDLKTNWFDIGGGLFCYFTLSSPYGKYGCWGLTETFQDLDTPKYNALLDLYNNENLPTPITTTPSPQPFSGVTNQGFEEIKYADFPDPGWSVFSRSNDSPVIIQASEDSITAYEGKNVLKFDPIDGAAIMRQRISLVEGHEYELSYYVKGREPTYQSIFLGCVNGWGNEEKYHDPPHGHTSIPNIRTEKGTPDSNGWYKVTKTFVANDNLFNINLRIDNWEKSPTTPTYIDKVTIKDLTGLEPTPGATTEPTDVPATYAPTAPPTGGPSPAPTEPASTVAPTSAPTSGPTVKPTTTTTTIPTIKPTATPTAKPTANPTVTPTLKPGKLKKPARPKINPVVAGQKLVSGTGAKNGKLILKVGKKKYTVNIGANGRWFKELNKKITVGTKITARVKRNGLKSKVRKVVVKPKKPILKKVTKKKGIVEGKTYSKATVRIKVKGKWYKVKADKKGIFKRKFKKLKKGSEIIARVKYKKLNSDKTVILVK